MGPLVSILIPCYNAEAWLPDTLESALAQTGCRCEIIVVDDGSSDRSLEVARRFAARGVTVLAQANRGASAARNAALRASRGEWIQFLDADDLLARGKIERQLALPAARNRDRMLAARWARFTGDPRSAVFSQELLCRDADPVDWTVLKLEEHAMMHPAAWLCPRQLVDRAGPWDETLSLDDDGEYFTRLVLSSAGVADCVDAVSYYRSRLPGSLSTARSARAAASALRSLESTAARLLARENSARTRHAAAVAGQRLIYESYPHAPEVGRRAQKLVAGWGGAAIEPFGGPKFRRLSRVVGWRLARRLQIAFRL